MEVCQQFSESFMSADVENIFQCSAPKFQDLMSQDFRGKISSHIKTTSIVPKHGASQYTSE